MNLKANKSNLKKYPKVLLGKEYTLEKERALIQECLTGFARNTSRHVSFDRADHLSRIDKILRTYGVEGMLLDKAGDDCSGNGSMSNVKHDIQYCNAGDTYAVTILYYNGVLRIADWGSFLE